jgi:hypothetical protein
MARHTKTCRRARLAAVVLLLVLTGAALWAGGPPALAQSGPNFNLDWHVIGGGGAPVSSAHYAVSATTGQAAAGPPSSTGPNYAVSGGFWYVAPANTYLPVLIK